MRRLATSLLVLLGLTLLTVPALAVDPPEDLGYGVIGIYTAPTAGPGSEVYLNEITAGEVYTIHFVLYHAQLTSYNLGGFEFSWRVEPEEMTPMVLGFEWPYEDQYVYNFGSNFNLLVGMAWRDPHMPGEPWWLCSADIMFMEAPSNAAVYFGTSTPNSIEGEMAYADMILPDELHVMKPNNANQTLDAPVFFFNQTVATQSASWSSVKNLFD